MSDKDMPLQRIVNDWEWVRTSLAAASPTTQLRESVRSSTRGLYDASVRTKSMVADTQASITSLTTPPPAVTATKQSIFTTARAYNNIIVGFVTALSVLPALRAGPGRIEQLRVAVRNLVVFGGGSAVLLCPEIVFRTATKASDLQQRVLSK